MQELSSDIQLNRHEFETFVLIYAAHIDFELSKNEINFIKQRSTGSTYQKMSKLFNSNSDYLSMQIILSHREKHYKTKADQDLLFNLLIELFEIDGDFSSIEKNFIPFFKKMIDSKIH